MSHAGSPEVVQPITLGDLQQLEQASAVEKIQQRAIGVKSALKVGGGDRAKLTTSDEAREAAQVKATQTTRNATAVRLQQVGKRLARLRGTRPVQHGPQHFNPV